jgi:hypothetical protein
VQIRPGWRFETYLPSGAVLQETLAESLERVDEELEAYGHGDLVK